MSSEDWFISINAKLESGSLTDDELLNTLEELPAQVNLLMENTSISDTEKGRIIEQCLVTLRDAEQGLIDRAELAKEELRSFSKSRNLVKKYYRD